MCKSNAEHVLLLWKWGFLQSWLFLFTQRHHLWSLLDFTTHCSLPILRVRGSCKWTDKYLDYGRHLILITAIKNVYLVWIECVYRKDLNVCNVCVCGGGAWMCVVYSPLSLRKKISKDQNMHLEFLYAILVYFLAETQIYCGKKVIDELTRDSDLLASVQETLKNWVLNITSRMVHANLDVLLKTTHLLIY